MMQSTAAGFHPKRQGFDKGGEDISIEDFQQRIKHKATLTHVRVGQDELRSVEVQVVEKKQVQIQGSILIANHQGITPATKSGLNGL
jgi:hypothetical protein